MKKELELLVELQQKDNALDKLRKKAEDFPRVIDENTVSINNFRSGLDEAKNNIKKLQVLKKEKEMDLDSKENEIKKHNMELNAVKTNEAYKALLSEIEKCKSAKLTLEDDILNIMVSIDTETVKVKEEENKLKDTESKIQVQNNGLKSELEQIKSELSKYEAERMEYAKQIPSGLLAQYDSLRENRQGLAIVPLDKENCGGCGMNLRPQNINDIYKGQELTFCDSCSRILYRPKEAVVEVKAEK